MASATEANIIDPNIIADAVVDRGAVKGGEMPSSELLDVLVIICACSIT